MLRLHIVPKRLSVHLANKVHGDNVQSGSALLSSTFRDLLLLTDDERWPLADEKRLIRIAGPAYFFVSVLLDQGSKRDKMR